jgi:hypothetical protein
MKRSAGDRLVNEQITVSDLDIEAAGWIGAGPRLVMDSGTLAAEIRQWNEVPVVTFPAFWEDHVHEPPPHRFPLV